MSVLLWLLGIGLGISGYTTIGLFAGEATQALGKRLETVDPRAWALAVAFLWPLAIWVVLPVWFWAVWLPARIKMKEAKKTDKIRDALNLDSS